MKKAIRIVDDCGLLMTAAKSPWYQTPKKPHRKATLLGKFQSKLAVSHEKQIHRKSASWVLVLKELLVLLKINEIFFFLLGFAIKVFVSGLNEFDRIKLTPVKDTSASFATFSKWLIAFLQHFSPEKHVSLASCSEYWNSENFLSRSYNKGRIWMYPLYVFNRFLHVRYIHAYAYATCNNVNEISLITKKYSRYYFKVMPLFAAVTDSFFKKDLQKEQRPGKQQESKAGNIRELAAGERVIRITIVRIFDYCCYFGLYPTCWL